MATFLGVCILIAFSPILIPIAIIVAIVNGCTGKTKTTTTRTTSNTYKVNPPKRTVNEVNQTIREKIIGILDKKRTPMTAYEISQEMGISPQKASALLKQLIEQGFVRKEVVQGKSYFFTNYKSILPTPVEEITTNSNTLDDTLNSLNENDLREMAKIGLQQVERKKMTANLKKFILERDDYTCQVCGASLHNDFNLKLEVDHIVPISKGGKTDPSNLQTLCRKCNRSKGAKPMEVFVGGK